MTESTLFLIVTGGVIVGNLVVSLLVPLLMKKVSGGKEELKPTQITLPTLLDYLNKLVELEFISVVEVPSYINGKNLITDFEEIQTEIVKNVMNSFSTSFFKGANMAGVKRDYLITFVTRATNARLIGYMKDHNFSLKK
jgi:hypothetical protein